MIFKLELSPQNFRYDVLYPLYSGTDIRIEYVDNLSLLAPLDSKSKRASTLCAHAEGLELAGNSEMVSQTFLISFPSFIQYLRQPF